MTKQEAVADAQKYANQTNRTVYVQRRGSQYRAGIVERAGWKLAETIQPETSKTMTIDITPQGMKTPEGIARVNAATRAFEDSAAELANRTMYFLNEHSVLLQSLTRARGFMDEQFSQFDEDLAELKRLAAHREKMQEAFLRSLAGEPRPTDGIAGPYRFGD